MSKLSDYADTQVLPREHRDPYVRGQREMFATVLKKIKRLLPAHDAEIREQAKREQLEADCAAICTACSCNRPYPDGFYYAHVASDGFTTLCHASLIRAAYDKARRESGSKDAERD